MIRKCIAAATVGGVLALGGMGAASAATTAPSTPTPSTFTCAQAPATLAKIATWESKVALRQTTLKTDLTKATAAGHPKAVAKINRRLARLTRVDHRLGTLDQLVTMACPGASAATSPS
jgi:hypothetical protein